MPFGAGPRICVGAQFAMTEAVLVLAALIGRFRVTRVDSRPVLPVGIVTTQPDHPAACPPDAARIVQHLPRGTSADKSLRWGTATNPTGQPDAATVTRMEPHALDISLYREALVVLGAAGVVIPLFHRLRVSSVLGFMLVGIVVGPFGIASLAPQLPWLSAITISASRNRSSRSPSSGVALLLFMIGLELSFERLWLMRRLVFGLGCLAGRAVRVGARGGRRRVGK